MLIPEVQQLGVQWLLQCNYLQLFPLSWLTYEMTQLCPCGAVVGSPKIWKQVVPESLL